MRFSAKIFMATSGMSMVTAGAVSMLILHSAQDVYRHQYEAEYRQKLQTLAGDFTQLQDAYDRIRIGQKPTDEERMKPLQRLADDESDVVRIVLRGPTGKILGDVRNRALTSDPTGVEELRIVVPSGAASPTYEFTAYITHDSLNRAINDLRSRFILITGALLAFSLAASYWLSRRLVRKVQEIRAAVDRISATGEFSTSVPVPQAVSRHDELDALAAHFNRFFATMKAAQDELIEAKKTEARAAVAAQVAHDIRSPLTSMTLALNQLQQTLRQAGVAEKLSALAHGISRVNGIINRLGKTHKKEQAEIVEAPRLTLVDKVLFDVAQEHALRLPATLELRIEGFEANPCVWAVIQLTELQSALSNILNNAFEATGPKGQVTLSVRLEGRIFHVSVRDQGVGIPPEALPRIFEREFTSGKAGGSGLGLFQARKAIEWAGGKISAESRPGVGTTMSFTLPVERAPGWITDRVTVAAGETLVVADDDSDVLAHWRARAAESGVPVRSFATIRELELAMPSLEEPSRLVFVLDQHAGEGITGLELIEKQRLAPRAYLCTFEYDDPSIQEKIKGMKIRLVPKPRLRAAVVELAKEGKA